MLTLANSVFPVPGGPYIRMFLYRPLFCLVFLVAMAMSRTRSSKEGCNVWSQQVIRKKQKTSICFLELKFTYTEHNAFKRVLRFTLQPFGRLCSDRWRALESRSMR